MNAGIALGLIQLSLDSHVGTSTAPYVTEAFPEVSGYGVVVQLGAQLRLGPRLSLGSRAALALMRVEQPAGALYAEAAWANPELSLAFDQPLLRREKWELRLLPRFAVGLPLAEHASRASQLEGRALTLANAFEGFGEPELFTPGVLPITPSARLELRTEAWCFDLTLKVPLLFRVADASLPGDSDEHALGVVPVVDLALRFQPWRWVAFGLGPRLSWRALAPVDDHRGSLQPLLAASAAFRPADAFSVAVSLRLPIAGPLGGSTVAGGLELGAQF